MIVSHKHRFIFVKTTKTAGTSIEIALSRFCGPKDVITPISADDEQLRSDRGFRGPQNFLVSPWNFTLKDWARFAIRGERQQCYFNHMSASAIKGYVGERVWSNYYKFCFERHPCERVISLYFHAYRQEPRPTMWEYLNSPMPLTLKSAGFGNYTIDGRIAVDRVCLYENLQQELEKIGTRLGLPEPLELPRAKGALRKDKRPFHEILSEREIEKVRELFQQEFELFGYTT